jgi:hypothetical protein
MPSIAVAEARITPPATLSSMATALAVAVAVAIMVIEMVTAPRIIEQERKKSLAW